MHVKDKSGLDDVYNFKTFGQSMILLFQVKRKASSFIHFLERSCVFFVFLRERRIFQMITSYKKFEGIHDEGVIIVVIEVVHVYRIIRCCVDMLIMRKMMKTVEQMSTSAGWDGVLDGIINEEDCQEPNNEIGYPGNCGSSTIGIAYLLSYLVISFLIVINMYIAVILENYSQATEDVQEGLTDDDYDMYYEIWQQFDPDGTQYIRYDQLSEFLDVLEPPLQIHKPNKYKIVSMDIPICKGDLMFCVDILDALTKDFFARKGNPIEETTELGEVQARPDEIGYEPVSSTLWRQREEYCARLIQNAWRKHKQQRLGGPSEESDDPDMDPRVRQTAVLVESDGFVTKNGHRVVIQGRSPSVTSRTADV